jgi:hypothetical protein
MRLRNRPGSARIGVLVWATWIVAAACAGASSEPRPVPSLASSSAAAAAFAEIRDAWSDTERTTPAALERLLERFRARFPGDGLIPLARVYLALVALQTGDLAGADRELAATESMPPGSARDLRTVAAARRLRLGANPDRAMDLLRPLVGKNVDPIVRAAFQEELTLVALASQRNYEAISYMDAWLRTGSEEDRDRTVARVSALVARLPKEVLFSALQAMRKERANFGYGIDIERILAGQLATIATQTGDVELARMLLDPNAGALVIPGDAGAELGALATSRRGLNVVDGRTVGLLLPTGSPALRNRAADVLRGVMWALGLPRGLREQDATPETPVAPETPGRAPVPDASAAQGRARREAREAHASCAPPEPAPPTREPRAEERLRLITHDDAGSADQTEPSLDELIGDGAAVIIAALDAPTAGRALRWGESHGVSVVAIAPPAESVVAGGFGFGFVLGESNESVIDALVRAVPSLAAERAAVVLEAADAPLYPPRGGRVGPLVLLPPVSCDAPTVRAGESRFPIAAWSQDKTRAWLVSGSPACARDVTGELSAARARGVVALTLEAAGLPAHAAGLRVVSASAGVIPSDAAATGASMAGGADGTAVDPRDDELRRFSSRLGSVSWWTALGRDAAVLARMAVDELPMDTATDSHVVTERRAHARDVLAAARARLWSTEAAGWTDTHAMKRTICAIDAASQ